MDSSKRQQLLAMLERDSLSIGSEIPEIEVGDDDSSLKTYIHKDECPDDDVQAVVRELRSLRNKKKQTIEENSVSFEEGKTLVNEIAGIERALNVLSGTPEESIEEEAKKKEVIRERKWQNFIDKTKPRD